MWEEGSCCGDPLWVVCFAAGMGSEPNKTTTCCTCSHGRLFQYVRLSLETILVADGLALCIKVDSIDYLFAGWWCDFA